MILETNGPKNSGDSFSVADLALLDHLKRRFNGKNPVIDPLIMVQIFFAGQKALSFEQGHDLVTDTRR